MMHLTPPLVLYYNNRQKVMLHLFPFFFFVKLKDTEKRYSTFGCELLAIYLAIRYFRHFLEGRDFIIFTDHKLLTFSFNTKSDKYSPREIRHLDYISQFSTDIRHVSRNENTVEKNNKKDSIAINRLKPAYIEKRSDRRTDKEPVAHENKNENVSTDDKYNSYGKTKSGRHIYQPTKLKNYVSLCLHTDIHTKKKDSKNTNHKLFFSIYSISIQKWEYL